MLSEPTFSFTNFQQDAVKALLSTTAILLLSILPIVIFIVRQYGSAHPAQPRGCRRLGLPPGHTNLHDEFDPKYGRGTSCDVDDKGKPSWRIKALFTHPIKSCAAVELDVADVVSTGFAFDRQFCFAEHFTPVQASANNGKAQPYWDARTLRNGHYSRLTFIRPEIWVPDPAAPDYAPDLDEVRSQGVMVMYYPRPAGRGLLSCLVKLGVALRLVPRELSFSVPLVPPPDRSSAYPSVPVKIWKDTPVAYDYGGNLPRSLREFLAPPDANAGVSRPLTLFRVDPTHLRQVFRNAPRKEELGFQPVTGFADAFPLNILNIASVHDVAARCARDIPQLSVRRFRTNIVVQGPEAFAEDHWKRILIRPTGLKSDDDAGVEVHVACRTMRCRLPNVDPATGIRHASEPDRTLKSYRRIDPGDPTNASLGMQCVPAVQEFVIRVGDTISLLETGEHYYIKLLKPGEIVEGV
ncbi:MOSC domain-containing protein 1, mitochondrial [Aspergillus udagawae]|uniref:MOSC domain-containing protein 1, mitochondrial n=1 Tax=Aspergillus udagawae TaxID=91492 RepID=A0ABQ1AYV5_9EURO|nr:MOSC domain-containing protein 1, mitochondrial [Aspergillus udagawae]GFG06834.1 MOSC domain-containing protein 1, mitochondrial [Aspergillus udagawae]GFG23032.1 MOSC domain-containing protein 1, mitochondrial [Aspergillus udagawae]